MLNIIASSLVTIALLIGGFNTATMDSLKYLTTEYWFSDNLGAFTELTSSDKMSAFPTVYNANLAKTIEVGITTIPSITSLTGLVSAPSLATIGTITTGVWNGTIVGAEFGGTGLSNPTGIIWSNGNIFAPIASGTSGQVLTSNGNDDAPTFQTYAFNESGNYTFTGDNTFTGTTTLSATTTLMGVDYIFPSTEGASSTSLTTDGSGNLSWQYPYYYYPTVASANTKISFDTATTSTSATLLKTRTAFVNASGEMRISVDLKNSDGFTYTAARIYINDAAVGVEQQVVGTNFVTKSQDLFVHTGDEVSVYFKTENPSHTATLQNFRIKYDRTATTSEGYIITN